MDPPCALQCDELTRPHCQAGRRAPPSVVKSPRQPPFAPGLSAGRRRDAALPTAAAATGGWRRGLRLHLPAAAAAADAAAARRPANAAPPGTVPRRRIARPGWASSPARLPAGRPTAAIHDLRPPNAALPAHDVGAAAPAGGLHAGTGLPARASTLPPVAHGPAAGSRRAALWHRHTQGGTRLRSSHASAPHAAHAQCRPAAGGTAAAAGIPSAARHAIHGGATAGRGAARVAVARLPRRPAASSCSWKCAGQPCAVGGTCSTRSSWLVWWACRAHGAVATAWPAACRLSRQHQWKPAQLPGAGQHGRC